MRFSLITIVCLMNAPRVAYPQDLSVLPLSTTASLAGIGQGMDELSGQLRMNCWEGDSFGRGFQAVYATESSFDLVRTQQDLTNFMGKSGSISGGIPFLGGFNIEFDLASEAQMQSSRLILLTQFNYSMDQRWMEGVPRLAGPYAQMLANKNYAQFFESCGTSFLRTVSDGATLIAMFQLDQHSQNDATDNEIKAAFDAYLGLSSAGVRVALTDRQQQIVDAYQMTLHCYVKGLSPDLCARLQNQNQNSLAQAFSDFTSNLGMINITSIKAAYANYGEVLQDRTLIDSVSTTMNTVAAWEQLRSQVNYLCDSSPYLPCVPALSSIQDAELICDDFVDASCVPPPPSACADVLAGAYIGQVRLYWDVSLKGPVLPIDFRIDDQGGYKPGIIYRLDTLAFDNVVSSVDLDEALKAHWILELYDNPDGTGAEFTTATLPPGQPLWWFGHSGFNDEASSFRLVRK